MGAEGATIDAGRSELLLPELPRVGRLQDDPEEGVEPAGPLGFGEDRLPDLVRAPLRRAAAQVDAGVARGECAGPVVLHHQAPEEGDPLAGPAGLVHGGQRGRERVVDEERVEAARRGSRAGPRR